MISTYYFLKDFHGMTCKTALRMIPTSAANDIPVKLDASLMTISAWPKPMTSMDATIIKFFIKNILKVELYDLRGRKIIQQNNLNKFESVSIFRDAFFYQYVK